MFGVTSQEVLVAEKNIGQDTKFGRIDPPCAQTMPRCAQYSRTTPPRRSQHPDSFHDRNPYSWIRAKHACKSTLEVHSFASLLRNKFGLLNSASSWDLWNYDCIPDVQLSIHHQGCRETPRSGGITYHRRSARLIGLTVQLIKPSVTCSPSTANLSTPPGVRGL